MPFSTLLLATHNNDKTTEIREVLQHLKLKIISANDLPQPIEIIEDRETLAGNAEKKAKILAAKSGLPTLADDTGLMVDALNGEPGVYSSRFAGENASYADNVNKLLQQMQGIPENLRTARFKCVMALCYNNKVEFLEGVCEGIITNQQIGEQGFGYDPVFYVPKLGKTFAEMTLDEKNEISHRGIALAKVKTRLQQLLHE